MLTPLMIQSADGMKNLQLVTPKTANLCTQVQTHVTHVCLVILSQHCGCIHICGARLTSYDISWGWSVFVGGGVFHRVWAAVGAISDCTVRAVDTLCSNGCCSGSNC